MSVDAGQRNLLVSSIEWRAECKKRAYRTVLALIEPNITASQLIECAPTLDPAHYEDVVEERYLGHLCGYPLCDNPVNKASQQKFHISVKDKKVYDLSEIKQFCSGWCCKASQYFASQLSTIPLWARQHETLPKIELLSKDSNSEKDSNLEKEGNSEKESNSEKDTTTESTTPGIHETTANAPSIEDSPVSLECLHISERVSGKGKVDSDIEQLSTEAIVETSNDKTLAPQLDNKPNINLASECNPLSIPSDDKPQPAKPLQMEANSRGVSDGPKVNLGPKHYGAPVQKLPPREKVMSALLQWKTPETVKFLAGSLPDFTKNDVNENENHRNYLPTIDSHNQMSLRRRIVTQQLMKGLSPILNQVGLTTQQVSGDIVAIVTTFNLQPANISFQPSLWTAVAAILLLLMRPVNKDLSTTISIDNMLPFVSGRADISEDDVKKCLRAFES